MYSALRGGTGGRALAGAQSRPQPALSFGCDSAALWPSRARNGGVCFRYPLFTPFEDLPSLKAGLESVSKLCVKCRPSNLAM